MTSLPTAARHASVRLFTYKRGLLSAVGHDLCLGVGELEVELAAGSVRASLLLPSIRVLGAIKRGELVPSEPSERDRREILTTVRERILDTERFPRAELEASVTAHGSSAELRGQLRLRGVARPVSCAFDLDVGSVVGSGASASSVLRVQLELVPSQWGIAPYSALGGALKLQDRVTVEVSLEVDAELLAQPLLAHARWTAKP